MKYSILCSIALASAAWSTITPSARALERTTIEESVVESSVPEVILPVGHSVTLHLGNDRYIQSVWIDDPALLGAVTDRPLCSGGSSGNCGFASAVRVTQLNGAINLPGVSFNDINGRQSSVVTLGTTTANGRGSQFYQFKITTTRSAEAQSSLISIVPNITRSSEQAGRPNANRERLSINAIKRGRDLAINRGIADVESVEWQALEDFISLTEINVSIPRAILDSSVSDVLLYELNRMGNQEFAEI